VVSHMQRASSRADATLVLSVHGPGGVVDLVVPRGATAVDVAREYAEQSGLSGVPLLQTSLGELVTADRPVADAGVESGDVLVAVTGVHRGRRGAGGGRAPRGVAEAPAWAALVAGLAGGIAVLAGWYGAHAASEPVRTAVVGILLGCALLGVVPVGRHAAQRGCVAPLFGGAAAFAALHAPGSHLLPVLVGASALAAATVAAVGRALVEGHDEALRVWIVAGLAVFAVCSLSPLTGWDPRVVWALLVLLALLAARFAPALAVDVPDEAMLDLDRLAVTAWSARDRRSGLRGRIVVHRSAMEALVASGSRTVTAAAAAIWAVVLVAAPLLLREATLDLDRIGARCLVLFAGAGLLLAGRSYRHGGARTMLRAAGLTCWAVLLASVAGDLSWSWAVGVGVVGLTLGLAAVVAAVATGRGWRSVRWARRAELAEALSGAFAFAATVVAAGVFRVLWEITS
jgi:hypothetical protein